MTPKQFHKLMERRGTNIDLWPSVFQTEARSFLATAPQEIQREWRRAVTLETMLTQSAQTPLSPAIDSERMERIVENTLAIAAQTHQALKTGNSLSAAFYALFGNARVIRYGAPALLGLILGLSLGANSIESVFYPYVATDLSSLIAYYVPMESF
ncbi:hypothetical protein CCP2SC5_250006 [Azospirillaceae bacterium]